MDNNTVSFEYTPLDTWLRDKLIDWGTLHDRSDASISQMFRSITYSAVSEIVREGKIDEAKEFYNAEALLEFSKTAEDIRNATKEECDRLMDKVNERSEAIDRAIETINQYASIFQHFEAVIAMLEHRLSSVSASINRLESRIEEADNKVKGYEDYTKDNTLSDEMTEESLKLFTAILMKSKSVIGEEKLTDAVLASMLEAASYATWRTLDPKQIAARNQTDKTSKKTSRNWGYLE